jgi:hypothetical protein
MKLIPSIAMPIWAAKLKVIISRCESCHKLLALRRLSARKAGITMLGNWYCSSRCFRSAAEQEVLRLLKPGMEQVAHVSRMPLGLNLISRGLLTIEQLKKATDQQKEAGGEIGELLVRQGSVSEKQVTAIRAAEWGCPVFTVPRHATPIEISIPSSLMRIYAMVPVHYAARTNLLLVGFVHSIEYGLLCAIEQMTGCQTKPCFVTPGDFQIQMREQEKAQGQAENPPVRTFENIQTPAEIARILCASGVETEADGAFIERCKEYLWARLKGGPNAVDILFKAG